MIQYHFENKKEDMAQLRGSKVILEQYQEKNEIRIPDLGFADVVEAGIDNLEIILDYIDNAK